MKKLPVNKRTITLKLDEIQRCIEKLTQFKEMTLDEFMKGENFAISEHYLRRALEAVFEIGSHILARLPGGKVSGYKDIAKKLEEHKIVSSEFAKEKLIKMAGYRNRLVHFYSEVTAEEMHQIIQNNLDDFDRFNEAIKKVLVEPGKYGLKVE
jgi:uncharacterized protein YutE (UPF0331/DUF86 family)